MPDFLIPLSEQTGVEVMLNCLVYSEISDCLSQFRLRRIEWLAVTKAIRYNTAVGFIVRISYVSLDTSLRAVKIAVVLVLPGR